MPQPRPHTQPDEFAAAPAAEKARASARPATSHLRETKRFLKSRASTPAYQKGVESLATREKGIGADQPLKYSGLSQVQHRGRSGTLDGRLYSVIEDRMGKSDMLMSEEMLKGIKPPIEQFTPVVVLQTNTSGLSTVVDNNRQTSAEDAGRLLGRRTSITAEDVGRLLTRRTSVDETGRLSVRRPSITADEPRRLSNRRASMDESGRINGRGTSGEDRGRALSNRRASIGSSSPSRRASIVDRPTGNMSNTLSRQRNSIDNPPPNSLFNRRRSSIDVPYRPATNAKTFLTSISRTTTPPEYEPQTAYLRFRRIARMVAHSVHFVKFLARILKNPIEWSWEYDPKTYQDEDDTSTQRTTQISPGSKNALIISYDLFGVSHLFARPKQFKGWLDHSMRVLFRKKRTERTRADLDRMVMWCSTMKCMEKYPISVQRALLQAAHYTRWHTGRQILKEGHPARGFYIILDGDVEITKVDRAKLIAARKKSVAIAGILRSRQPTTFTSHPILADREQAKDEGVSSALASYEAKLAELAARKSSARQSVMSHDHGFLTGGETASDAGSDGSDDEEVVKVIREIEEELNKAYTVTVGHITSGDSFGEISFLTSSLRTTTYTTKRTCEFLTVSRKDYERVLSTYKESETVKQDMLRTLPIFKTLNADMATLTHCCVMRKFDANKVVITQGVRSSSLYFISSGTCRVVQAIQFVKEDLGGRTFRIIPLSQLESTIPQTNLPAISRRPTSSSTTSSSSSTSSQTNLTSKRTNLTSFRQYLPPNLNTFTELLTIHTLGPGEYFGETVPNVSTAPPTHPTGFQALQNPQKQPASIITNTKSSLLIISKIDFQRLATDSTWRYLRQEASLRPSLKTVEEAWLESRGWRILKKKVVEDVVKGLRKGHKRVVGGRDPYGFVGDGLLAWAY
ncbi:uncharacterized protein SPPG_07053 [Spizellomyces punctatus DAOM BR117]|uniref:Cyclic nucleotide-binding domain-containing protein n=1 Tax=Spizellomyces punctatus (strain DAOM BR117) TaxID=645134 RepID=A0A0L0H9B5_SPIPD|nr:uncharacterized protein SPPG_07053 [Spizellomyces punctatus DAOM BR117]KNC97581.1 hypothetical protein SPPG_07053 [Spizellomyces punctatus DAOM BR117]|eukprot:XP_016605621.1 hypothetical protein SPPG_07053 [Spizellomyces punctatus DAOM BR117]